MTPAYLSFQSAFNDQQWGQGAAIAFILFAIIVVLTLLQRAAAEGAAHERRRTPGAARAHRAVRRARRRSPSLYILPFLIDLATSFKTEPEAAADPLSLVPQTFTTAAYERLFVHLATSRCGSRTPRS